jgi:GT2 family glycosyltransferase
MSERERRNDSGGLATNRRDRAANPPRRATAREALDLSVCIVNWNCRDLLRGCLRSLREQPLGLRFEVIVVDNASADGAAEMVAREFPEVRLLCNSDNVGFARANNQAALAAQGRHLLFLNNDTLVPPGVLRQLVEFLDDHADVALLGPRLRDGSGKVQMSFRKQPTPWTFLHRTWLLRVLRVSRGNYRRYRRKDHTDDQPHDVDVLMGAAVVVPRVVFDALGGWDEDFTFGGEDMEFCHRARRLGRIVHWPAAEVTHYAKYFRKTGASRMALSCYKLAVVVDALPRLLARSVQYGWRRLRGRPLKAEKCRREITGLVAFLCRGLVAFWRA